MPECHEMRVIPERVVEHVCNAMIESNEQMSSCGTIMPKDHPPCRAFFPAIDSDIAEKLIPPNLNPPAGIERHLVRLAEVPTRIAEIRIGDAAGWWRRRRNRCFISSVPDEHLIGDSARHRSDVAHSLLAIGRIGIGLDVETVSRGKSPERGLSGSEDVQGIRCHRPNILCIVWTCIDNGAH